MQAPDAREGLFTAEWCLESSQIATWKSAASEPSSQQKRRRMQDAGAYFQKKPPSQLRPALNRLYWLQAPTDAQAVETALLQAESSHFARQRLTHARRRHQDKSFILMERADKRDYCR